MVIAHGEGAGTGSSPEMIVIESSGGETIGTILLSLFRKASISRLVDMKGPNIFPTV